MVYVRQSHPQQVAENVESTARQYGLVERAIAWGWSPERVIVIDEDQGQSGQSMATRLGFQRLLAEVSLDHVGLILGLELSRLARSNKDWHQLLELCAIFGTLLADADGLYDPTDYNDRLLLGLRGMMNEAELYILKGRMHEGRRNKAQRGDLLHHPPMGSVRGADGDYQLDPDEQAHLVGLARETLSDGKWLIAGTGAESTRQTIALSKAAAAAGADAVLVRPPSYFSAGATLETLAIHFRAVADASPVPVLIYNIPKYTHLSLAPALLQQLASHERIIGVKDSSGDPKNLAAYRGAVPQWSVLAGSASLLFTALELGCQGGVVGVACYAPSLCVQLVREFEQGHRAAAGQLQERITPLDKEIVGKLGPAGVKAAMDAVGLYGGPVRPPLAPLSAADRERVSALVRGD